MMQAVTNQIFSLYKKVLAEREDVDAIAELALALAESGARRKHSVVAADVASSGGPGSLSTLLCPLHLVDAGYVVPKVGVPGRPAGGIDVLGTIPDYKTHLSLKHFEIVLENAGYAHVVADETWAPADAALFRLRQANNTQSVPALAVASLLAKKIAAGVQVAGLEGRVSRYGNFGTSLVEARASAELYCRVAARLGLTSVVVLTDAEVPYQPFIGRGEALRALHLILTNSVEDEWLARHADMCREVSSIVAASATTSATAGKPEAGAGLASIMAAHLKAQGSSVTEMERQVQYVIEQKVHTICSERAGYVHYDLKLIRDAIVGRNAVGEHRPDRAGRSYLDEAGVRLLCPPWREVSKGEPVLEFRYRDSLEEDMPELFTVQSVPAGETNSIMGVIAS